MEEVIFTTDSPIWKIHFNNQGILVRTEGILRSSHTYSGEHLALAITRAKRWAKCKKASKKFPPRHIFLNLAAYAKADPRMFAESVYGLMTSEIGSKLVSRILETVKTQ